MTVVGLEPAPEPLRSHPAFVHLVLQALYKEVITYSRAAEMLELKIHDINVLMRYELATRRDDDAETNL
jgi:hypothetical protein